jgi:hypothetical protein
MDEAPEKQLPLSSVDLDALAEAMRQGGDAYLDPATGRIHAYRDEAGDDAIPVGSGGSGGRYSEVQTFVDHVSDPALKDELDAALDGRRLFSDFGDVIKDAPEHVRAAWAAYRGVGPKLRALSWLGETGLVRQSEIDAEQGSLEAEAASSLRNL